MVLVAVVGGGTQIHAEPNKAAIAKLQVKEHSCGDYLQCQLGGSTGSSISSGTWKGKAHSTGEVISWPDASQYAPGSIIVRTPERRLYYVLGDGKALRYKVGVGRDGFQWSGTSTIVAKQEWPDWHPPEEMISREAVKGHILPTEMAGGPNNPLGARAMYIGGTLYRIHGSNDAASIGGASSSGCIRMMNADVMELYDRVKIGAPVYVYQ